MAENLSVTVEQPNSEPETETSQIEVVEEVTEAAVEIAQIEAERDITIAAIHAETQQHETETRAEVETARIEERTELDLCREEIQVLRSTLTEVEAKLNLLTQPPQLEMVEVVETIPETEQLETQTEPSLIPSDISIPIQETATEALESVNEDAEKPIKAVRRFVAI